MTIAAVDIETDDPGLKTYGAGAIRNYGEILTVAVYCPDWNIDGWYTWDQFMEDDEVLALMADPDVVKVFHNGVYDMNWLQLWGEIEVNNIDDTMTRETLLDAYALSYSLDNCCMRRGVQGKNKGDTIDKWYAEHVGKGKAIEHLKEIPVEIVGKYNLQDVHATYDLYFAQQPLLEQQGLVQCNDIERKLYPWLMLTKKNGMRLDIKKRQRLSEVLEEELDELQAQFRRDYGDVNVGSYLEMERLWKRLGIPVIYSDSGRPSFSHDILADTDHPVAELILRIRGLDKLLNTFIDGQFVDLAYRGYLHPDLYPALRDEGGTVTGRFSCLAIGTNVFTTERGYVPIETLHKGEHVITHTGNIRPIKSVMFTGIREVGNIPQHTKLLCTASHLLFDGQQWVSAECNPAIMEVDENELVRRQRLSQESSGNLSGAGQTNKGRALQTSWCMFSVCASDTERGHPVRCLGSGEGTQVLSLKSWGEESDEGYTTDELYWGRGRWSRLPTKESEREVLLYASDNNGGGTWYRCLGDARLGGHTPHRWEPEKQCTGESLFGDSSWSQTLTRRVPGGRRWKPMGIIPTFDIEVDGPEHSFVAEGVIVHNSRNPNGQNIPARGDKHGEEIRSLFIPEDGCILGAFDYKQIEYRVFTHFAYGPGAEEAQAAYWDHPVDYHQMVQEMMGWVTGDKKKDKEFRHVTKNLNFGSIYGLGWRSFAERFKEPLLNAHPGWPKDEVGKLAKTLLDEYFEKIPFVRPTCQLIQQTAQRRGYVKTVSGRRQRFPPDNKAYKMVNYLIQGSAGDIMKKAIVDAWDEGVWDVLIPHMMVHDELVFSIPDTKEGYEACLKLKDCMEHSYKLKIPLGVDTEIGPDWGHCTEENWEQFENKWRSQ